MATSVKLEVVYDNISKKLESMVDRAKSTQTYFSRVAYPQYQLAQINRWDTENDSETGRWKPLDTLYAHRKLTKFAGYDYGGAKILIATGDLLKSVVGRGSGKHAALFTKEYMEISTMVDYAGFVADQRPFMDFSEATLGEWQEDLARFIDGLE